MISRGLFLDQSEDHLSSPFRHELLTQELVTYERVHVNIPRSLIVITEDRLQLWLSDLIRREKQRFDWLAPFGIVLSTTSALVTAEFKNLIVTAETWHTVFVVVDILAALWLAYALRRVAKPVNPGAEIKQLKDFSP
jgi:hypothetical protein